MKKLTLLMTFLLFLYAGLYAQNALHFNSGTPRDYVRIPNAAALNLGTGRFTMEAMIRMPATGQTTFPTIISKRASNSTSPSATGFAFYIVSSTGKLAFQINGANTASVGPNLIDDSCHHVAVVRGDSGRVTGYIDGQPFIMANVNNGNMSNTDSMLIGWDDAEATMTQFLGTIDEIRIWKVARTIGEINTFMNTTVNPASTDLIAYYQFNHGVANGNNTSPSVNTLIDETSNSNDGILRGFALNGTVSNWVTSCIQEKNPCDIFGINLQDTNCCTAGIIRNTPGGADVESISYAIAGGSSEGVIQGYTTDCPGASPVSSSISGTSSGTVTFSSPCSNMQFFSTALQSMNSTGNMTITYVVHFVGGDSCSYKTDIHCPRAPKTVCDSVDFQLCVCPGAQQSYFNVNIHNYLNPSDDICAVLVTLHNSGGAIIPWNSGYFIGGSQMTNPNIFITSPTDFGTISTGFTLNLQYWFSSSVTVGSIQVTIIHCNGDTCRETWKPQVVPGGDVGFTDFTISRGVNPFPKLFAYTFKVTGPSKTFGGTSPYKVKYITLSIKDTSGNTEIAALTGAEMYSEKGKWDRLKFSLTSHGRYNALFQMQSHLDLKSKDSSGVFQVIFANALPKEIIFNCYGTSGSVLSSGTLALDTSGSVGIVKLGKKGLMNEGLMIFNGFPTPTNGKYNVKLNLQENDNISLHVFDINGREVLVSNLGLLNNGLSDGNIDLSVLETGNYFINAVSQKNGGVSNTIKVVLVK